MVTYSSLDEVYGRDFTNKYNDKLVSQDEFTKVKFNQDPIPLFLQNKGYNQENCFKNRTLQHHPSSNVHVNRNLLESSSALPPMRDSKYEIMKMQSKQNFENIQNKRNEIERPKTISEDEKKKMLLDKLSFLEKQLKKYKNEDNKHSSSCPPLHSVKEHFQSYLSSNQNQTQSISMNQDFMDLTLLIVIGFVFIFFLDTVFQMGKKIGQRKI
jgi:hypothetical protein